MSRSLILIEHDGERVKRASLHAVSLARLLSDDIQLLLVGHQVDRLAASLQGFGASAILVADCDVLAEPVADRDAALVARIAHEQSADVILGSSSTLTKDILPRVAALIDVPMLTDVCATRLDHAGRVYDRPVSAGSQIATVRVQSPRLVLTARATAFQAPEADSSASPIVTVEVNPGGLPSGTEFISREQPKSGRPDLGEARVVVCGGRPLGDKVTFERLIGGLADVLGGAVGATRAAVDAGMAPNDFQVGQTGKIVAPELYFAIGVSGAIQHLAGIQDSRIIVAINRDPEAPIFASSTYGVVGDLHQLVPALMDALRQS